MLEKIAKTLRIASENSVFSSLAIAYVIVTIVSFSYDYEYWKKNKIVDHDVVSYYGYLPSAVIYQDLSLDYLFDGTLNNGEENVRIWFEHTPDGKRYFKMPVGVSVMTSPFFITAHFISKASGKVSNGFNETYFFSIVFAAWFYAFLSLLLLRKVLREFQVSDIAIAATLISLFLATNVLCYSSVESGMSHIYGLFTLTLCFYGTVRWHKQPKMKYALMIGIGLGLATIIRPTNVIFAMIPVLYGIHSLRSFKDKLSLISKHIRQLAICLFAFGAMVFIQLLVWKLGTGNWVVYSYNDEKLFLGNTHIIEGLFGYRKGLFVYCPILFISLVGWIFMWKKHRKLLPVFLLFLFIYMYVIFSWWCWWYGGSFGMRAMIETFVILAIPMAVFFDRILNRWTLVPVGFLIGFAINLNFFLTDKYLVGFLHMDSMTKAAYWELMTIEHLQPSYWDLMQKPNYYNALLGNSDKEVYQEVMTTVAKKEIQQEKTELFSIPAKDYFYRGYPMQAIQGAELNTPNSIEKNGNLQLVTQIRNSDSDEVFFFTSDTLITSGNNWNKINSTVALPTVHHPKALIEVFLINQTDTSVNLRNYQLIKEVK